MEIKRDVRHPSQCKGCDDDSSQGTSRDAEDVVVMTRMITPARAIILLNSIGDAGNATMIVIMTVIHSQFFSGILVSFFLAGFLSGKAPHTNTF